MGLLKNACPRCGRAEVFTGWMKMRTRCPECGLVFEREYGYYLGAMVFSYIFGALSVVPTAVIVIFLLKWGPVWLVAIGALQILILTPTLFRYSRLVWLHLDQKADPR